MFRPDDGDDSDLRWRDAAERGDLADSLRAHLDDGVPVLWKQAQQRDRDAGLGVEIAGRAQRRSQALEQRRRGLLHAGLAVAARDRDDARLWLPRQPYPRDRLQRRQWIDDDDVGYALFYCLSIGPRAENRRRATFDCGR